MFPQGPSLTLSLAIFCRWICGHGERGEGPSSCWQRRLAADSGRVSRRPTRLPSSPPLHHGLPRLVSFQPMPWLWFPTSALGRDGPQWTSHSLLGPRCDHKTPLSWGRVDSDSPRLPGYTQCPARLHPSFLASKLCNCTLALLRPGWMWIHSEYCPSRRVQSPQVPACSHSCAISLQGRMAQW